MKLIVGKIEITNNQGCQESLVLGKYCSVSFPNLTNKERTKDS